MGHLIKLNKTSSAAARDDALRKLHAQVSNGYAIEGPVWGRVIDRRRSLFSTLALIMDETRKEVFGKDAKVFTKSFKSQCSLPSCTNTTGTGPDGKQMDLLRCPRCQVALYCR